MTLSQLEPGNHAIVRNIQDGETGRFLMEMGIIPGTQVTLLRRAPLGDPLEVRVLDASLSIRKSEAGLIQVEPVF